MVYQKLLIPCVPKMLDSAIRQMHLTMRQHKNPNCQSSSWQRKVGITALTHAISEIIEGCQLLKMISVSISHWPGAKTEPSGSLPTAVELWPATEFMRFTWPSPELEQNC